MTKKYLIDAEQMFSFQIENKDAKEVEVMDWDEIEVKFKQSKFLTFTQFARANNLQIIKIK